MNNPYSATTADLSAVNTGDDTYDPKMFAVDGRIGRIRYLGYSFAITMLLMLALGVIAGLGAVFAKDGAPILMAIGVILFYIPAIAVMFIMAIRRLNDLDHSGWLSLVMLVPLVNVLLSLYLMFAPGTNGNNNYGPKPSKNSTLLVVLAVALPVFVMVVGILAAIAIPQYANYVERAKAAEQSQQRGSQTQGEEKEEPAKD